MELLSKHYPEGVSRDRITEVTDYKRSTRDAYIHRLTARELVESTGSGQLRAKDLLFLE